MPVSTDTFRNIGRLNVVFAATSLVALASTLWMLRDDHERAWRNHQRANFNLQAANAYFDLLAMESAQGLAERERRAARVKEAEAQMSSRRAEESRLAKREHEAAGELQAAALAFGNVNAQSLVTLWEYEEAKSAHGEQDARTVAVGRRLASEQERLTELKQRKEALEDELESIRAALKAMRAPLEAARKQLAEWDAGVADAKKRARMYGKGFQRSFLNLPVLDFAAPKNLAGREEIRQVVLPEVRQEYNFLQSYTVDRCTTCHVGIDQPEATLEAYVAKWEKALRTINESRVAAGKKPLEVALGRAAPAGEGGHGGAQRGHDGTNGGGGETGPASSGPAAFSEKSAAQRAAYAEALATALNVHLKEEGYGEIAPGQPLLAHPRLDLYVSADSPHPLSKMGCTSCHEGNGQETDFMYAAHAPASHAQEHEWEKKYYVRTWGIEQASFELIHEYWDRPMMPARYAQATCAKCHTEISDLAKAGGGGPADKLVEGRKLFTQLGCINCHLVEGLGDSRRVGPDLTHVGEKLGRGFLHRWIESPQEFRPSTWMPHFFRQENSVAASANEFDPDPLLRTETEVLAIAHWLETFSRPSGSPPLPPGAKGDAKHGWELVTSVGCLACHSSLGSVDPGDESGRTFGRRWIEDDLVHSGVEREEAARRVSKMSLNEQVRYAMEHFTESRHTAALRELERLRGLGEDTSELYVPPYFSRFAPEMSGLGTKLAAAGDDEAAMASARRWLAGWLRDPRHYHPGSKMPRLFSPAYYWNEADAAKRVELSERDILDVTEYLLSLRHDTFTGREIARDEAHLKSALASLRQLLEGQFTAGAATMVIEDRKASESEPYGALTAAIVKQVERSIGREEAERRVGKQDLAGRQLLYLGAKMITHYGCNACHVVPGFETASRPGTELTYWGEKRLAQLDFAFFSPGYEKLRASKPEVFGTLYPQSAEYEHLAAANGNEPQEIVHNRAAFAYHKLRNPRIWDREKIKRPYDKLKMPNFYLTPEQAEALTTYLLSRVHPLVTPAVQVDYAGTPLGGIAAGRHLTTELNCVGCHRIEGNEPSIWQYLMVDDPSGGRMVDELNAPPLLHGEGAKINHGWLHLFLRQVEMLRPWLRVRMPGFHLTEDEATTVVKYFASVSQRESSEVRKRLEAVHAHQKKQAAAGVEGAESAWLSDPHMALTRDYLREYGLSNRLVRAAAVSETDNSVEELGKAYAGYLKAAGFVSDLLDVEYPFVQAPYPELSLERFALGEKMFLEMKCLACHVFGDPRKEGSNANPSAPNLNLTHRRLRREWVRAWLQYPGRIQPGTKMPQWWGDGGSLASFPKEDYEAFAAQYGKTAEEQMSLLEDFMYDAGLRNYTVTDASLAPPAAETQPGAEEQPDFESEFLEEGSKKEPASKPNFDEDFEG